MVVRWIRLARAVAALALVLGASVVGVAAPARAEAGEFSWQASYGCTTVAGNRHWDNDSGTGPRDATTSRSIDVGPCQPIPVVSFEACDGELRVTMSNGGDGRQAGGTLWFEVFGERGWHAGPFAKEPWDEPGWVYVPSGFAGSVVVTASPVKGGPGEVVAEGSYETAPRCDRNIPGPPPPPPPPPVIVIGGQGTTGPATTRASAGPTPDTPTGPTPDASTGPATPPPSTEPSATAPSSTTLASRVGPVPGVAASVAAAIVVVAAVSTALWRQRRAAASDPGSPSPPPET